MAPPDGKLTSNLPETAANVEFNRLLEVVAKLRGPNGCPWDKEQTQRSLVQYILEEAYELVEAIETGEQRDICEELGDFLFQVVLQAQVAQDENHFSIVEVMKFLSDKMIHRHPHVFGDLGPQNIEQVWQNWDQLKAKESAKTKPLFSYPRSMPALQAAHKIGVKSEGFKFDWENAAQVLEKVKEEMREVEQAFAAGDARNLKEEIGDLLFVIAQLARHSGLEAEECLREGNRKFERRFVQTLEFSKLDKNGFRELTPAQKEKLWQLAKAAEKKVTDANRG